MQGRKEKIKTVQADASIERESNSSYNVKQLMEVLSQYEPDALVQFEDFNFSSSCKENVLDVVFQEEVYPSYDNMKRVHRVILINKKLNFDKQNTKE